MKAYRVPGLTGESPELVALWDLGCLGIQEEEGIDEVAVLAYFDEPPEGPMPVQGEWTELPDVDYVARYQAGLQPVRVGPVVVAPSHARVELGSGETVIWLDPGAAFGTGHHETTSLALEALAARDLRGGAVLDLGAGSGLLAIAADRLGAERVYGLDLDGATVRVARENALRNRSRARFAAGTLGQGPVPGLPGHFDVIVANLYAELHAQLLPCYVERLVPGGTLLLTGILVAKRRLVEEAATAGVRLVGEARSGDWLLLEYAADGRP